MTKYVFSKGKIRVLDGIILKPEQRHHPLRTATMFIVCNPETGAGSGIEQELAWEADRMGQQPAANIKPVSKDNHS